MLVLLVQALLGIAAIKNISEQGIAIKAYDYNENVGGNWIYSKNSSHSSVFETTLIISSKMLSQHEDFPFKASVADYLSHQESCSYFQIIFMIELLWAS